MIRKSAHIFWLLSFCYTPVSKAQSLETDQSKGENFVSTVWHDIYSSTSAAFTGENYNTQKVIGFTAAAVILFTGADIEMNEEYGIEKENSLGLPKVLGKIGNLYDKPNPFYFSLGLIGSMYGAGKILDDNKLINTTVLMTKAVIVTGVLTTGLKVIIGRARPDTDKRPRSFRPFNYKFDADYMSMPSGHTASIFAMMTVIAKEYDNWYVQMPAYTIAASVAIQRMRSEKHWTSDLLIGGTIGYLIADAMVKNKIGNESFKAEPAISHNGLGLNIYF